MTDTDQPAATASALRQQITEALAGAAHEVRQDFHVFHGFGSAPGAITINGNIDELVAAVLAVILPHGKFLGDQLRDAETRLAETRAALDEVLRHFVHKGHPGEPCLQSGWISEKTVARWHAVLYPPQPAPGHNDGPTVREAAANDRRWWETEKAGE
jgi:hypothetical protein